MFSQPTKFITQYHKKFRNKKAVVFRKSQYWQLATKDKKLLMNKTVKKDKAKIKLQVWRRSITSTGSWASANLNSTQAIGPNNS